MTHSRIDPELLERPRKRRGGARKARRPRKRHDMGLEPRPARGTGLAWLILGFLAANRKAIALLAVGMVLGALVRGCFDGEEHVPVIETEEAQESKTKPQRIGPDLLSPVRPAPERFKRDSTMPKTKETEASMSVYDVDFSAGRDLVYVEDRRVWWESDNDDPAKDDECDHSMHVAMEVPFRRLSNLVAQTGKWELRVQEAYRSSGVHSNRSLHKQGRAIDLTVERLHGEKLTPFEKIAAYEELAKLAWQAGFDWVYYENSRGTGPHIHASVRPDGRRLTREEREFALKETKNKPRAIHVDTAATKSPQAKGRQP